MKKQIFIILSLCCLLIPLVAAPTSAQMLGTSIRVTIPFDFSVRGRTLPAGRYEIRRITEAPDGLVVFNEDTHQSIAFETESAEKSKAPKRSEIVFHRYGDNYFLYEVWAPGENEGRELPTSKSERAMKRQLTTALNKTEPQTVVLALN